MKQFILLLFSLTYCLSVWAQISEGGFPPSFNVSQKKSLRADTTPLSIKVDKDIERLKWEDSITERNGAPPRVAVIIPVNIDITQSGTWETLSDGRRICRLTINSPDALGIILYYEKFDIPKDAKLFIYNKDKTQLLGAYTKNTNTKGGRFSTEIVYGDELTLEYVNLSDSAENPKIIIDGIGYGYNHISDYDDSVKPKLGYGDSASCEVDVNCSEGNNWKIQQKGIAKIITKNENFSYYCSGSMINNSRNDYTPYFLSAYHCFYESDNPEFDTMQFYFHYEKAGCDTEESESSVNARTKTMIGAELLVANKIYGGSDGALLRLNTAIPTDYDVCYNGWDVSSVPAENGVSIHHPQGDVKKISTFKNSAVSGTYSDKYGTSIPNAHWVVNFVQTENGYGITEGGSSGSPLFNQNGLIVGSLTGGSSSCSNPSGSENYSKLVYNWTQSEDESLHMQKYLSPDNPNLTSLDKLYPFDQPLIVNTDSVRLRENTTYSVNIMSGNGEYSVTVDNPGIATASIDGNKVIIKGLKNGQTNMLLQDRVPNKINLTVNVFSEAVTFSRIGNLIIIKVLESEKDNAIKRIQIIDMSGRVMLRSLLSNDSQSYELDTLQWNKGVYIVKVEMKNGDIITKKVLW